jgi:hypothetical protein
MRRVTGPAKHTRLRMLFLIIAIPVGLALLYLLADWTGSYSRAFPPGFDPPGWLEGLPLILVMAMVIVALPVAALVLAAAVLGWTLRRFVPGLPRPLGFLAGGAAGFGVLWLISSSIGLAALFGFLPGAVTTLIMLEVPDDAPDIQERYDNG